MGKKSRLKAEGNREKIAEIRSQYAAKKKKSNKKVIFTLAAIVVVLAAVIGTTLLVVKNSSNTVNKEVVAPTASVDGSYGILIGKGGKVVNKVPKGVSKVTIFQDYQCPACKSFEETFSGEINEMINNGDAVLEYKPIAILDAMSQGTNYSSRAANVAWAVLENDPNAFYKFNTLMYEKQPEEGTKGLTNAQIMDIAKEAGAGDISAEVKNGTYRGYVEKATEDAVNNKKVAGTPTVYLNDKEVQVGNSLYDMVKEANKELAKKK